MAVEIPQRVLDRIWDRVDMSAGPDACWPWKLSIGSHGYGQVGWHDGDRTRVVTAHRAAWSAANDRPIPDGLTVDHICRNRPCCNPAHLRLLTNTQNASDNGFRRRTHCPQGHPYDAFNTYFNTEGHRSCRECNRLRSIGRTGRYIPRPPRYGRICADCGEPVAPDKRRDAIFCSKVCAARVSRRNYKARKRAERRAAA